MSPRSILKCSSPAAHSAPSSSSHSASYPASLYSSALPYAPQQPNVHFPPSPSLAKTYPTFSVAAYDRAPIAVVKNDCALPERGCPGRTYDACSKARSRKDGVHPHPRAADIDASRRQSSLSLSHTSMRPPSLIPDVSSSESDESDGLVSPPEYLSSVSSAPMQSQHPQKVLSFLPYAPPPIQDREKREKKRRSLTHSMSSYKSEDGARSFAASSLEGCLGGF